MFQNFDDTDEAIDGKHETVEELLKRLQSVPKDVREIRQQLYSIQNTNELYITVLQELLWLLKDQERRLKELESV